MKKKSGKFYECAVQYDKMSEGGELRKVTECYCVEAGSFAEAEQRVTDEVSVYSEGEFDVRNITPASYCELFMDDDAVSDGAWFKAKLEFISVDERTLREKKTSVYYLVLAGDFARSLAIVQEAMTDTMTDYVTAQIGKSKVLDVYFHES